MNKGNPVKLSRDLQQKIWRPEKNGMINFKILKKKNPTNQNYFTWEICPSEYKKRQKFSKVKAEVQYYQTHLIRNLKKVLQDETKEC